MLKHRPRTSAGWTKTAAKCGIVALGAGLLTAIASTGAQAAAPAHGTITGNGVNVRNSPNGAVVGSKNKGNKVSMYCSYTEGGVLWDEIVVSNQWVAAGYVKVDSGTVPDCDGLSTGLGSGRGDAGNSSDEGANAVEPATSAQNQNQSQSQMQNQTQKQLGDNAAASASH